MEPKANGKLALTATNRDVRQWSGRCPRIERSASTTSTETRTPPSDRVSLTMTHSESAKQRYRPILRVGRRTHAV